MTRNWRDDDDWQRTIRDRILVPGFYERFSPGEYSFIDQGDMTAVERRVAVDTVARSPVDGEITRFEEKIWRAPHTLSRFRNYPLETRSCTVPGRESDGWMLYSSAEILLGAFCNRDETELDVHLLDMPKLKAWFWPRVRAFKIHVHQDTPNRSEARLVPFSAVPPEIVLWRGTVCEPDIVSDIDAVLAAWETRPMGRKERAAWASISPPRPPAEPPFVPYEVHGWRRVFRYDYQKEA